MKFQEVQSSIERRSQIGMALTDSYVASARKTATDRERPEAVAKVEAAIGEVAVTDGVSDVRDANPIQNRKVRRSAMKRYATRDRLVNGGW
jgi:hypothetical protein